MDKPYPYNMPVLELIIGPGGGFRAVYQTKYLGGATSRPRRRSTKKPSIKIWNRKKPPFKSLDGPMYLTEC